MKIEKKHATSIAMFIRQYLLDGYWGITPDEDKFILRVLGFATHHKYYDTDQIEDTPWWNVLEPDVPRKLPPKASRARLDVNDMDVEPLLDMLGECRQGAGSDEMCDLYGDRDNFKSLERYLAKVFNADSIQDS